MSEVSKSSKKAFENVKLVTNRFIARLPGYAETLQKSLSRASEKNIRYVSEVLRKKFDVEGIYLEYSFIDKLRNKLPAVNKIVPFGGKMADKGAPAGRPMKYPYTFSARIAQFPLKHYIQNQWIWKYYAISLVVSAPLFYYFTKLSNSPGNVAKWAEIRRKELEDHH